MKRLQSLDSLFVQFMDPRLHEIVIGHGRAVAEMMRRVTAVDLGGETREPIEEHGLVRFL